MFGRSIFLFLVLAQVITAADESWLIRVREDQLAKALSAKDKAALSTLADKDFRIHWTDASSERSIMTDADRDDWIDDLVRLRIDSYEAVISKIDLPGRDHAFVQLAEIWTVQSPRGTRIEKRFITIDTWFKQQGTWKLEGRFCQSRLPDAENLLPLH